MVAYKLKAMNVEDDALNLSPIRNNKNEYPRAYMGINRSPLPWNNGNITLPFFGGNFPIVLLDNIY